VDWACGAAVRIPGRPPPFVHGRSQVLDPGHGICPPRLVSRSQLDTPSTHLQCSLHGRTGGKGVPQCQHYTALAATFRNKAVQYLRAAREVPTEAASDAYLAGLLMLLSHDVSVQATCLSTGPALIGRSSRRRQAGESHGLHAVKPYDFGKIMVFNGRRLWTKSCRTMHAC
jgi:hypothetical protein